MAFPTSTGAQPNVMQTAANAYGGAVNATSGAMGYQPQLAQARGYNAAKMGAAPQMAGMNLSAYMNPYTQNVINTSMADLNRGRQMALGQVGAQATAAGAFGGSRHGVAEAETNRGFAEQAAQMAAGLRQNAFNNAQGMAQFDIGNRMSQMSADQAALNAARQFGASAMNNASQFNAGQDLAGANYRLGAANQLSGLAGQGFGFGMDLNQRQMQQGAIQQALMQDLINAAKMQYGGFTGQPVQGVQLINSALANLPGVTNTTQSSNPGLLGILGGAAQIAGMFCWVAREVYGEEDPRWMQFRHWLTTDAPKWLLNVYAKHGEAFAGVVRKVPVLKRVLRPLMDRARRAAGFEG